jgi:hypothetical protein
VFCGSFFVVFYTTKIDQQNTTQIDQQNTTKIDPQNTTKIDQQNTTKIDQQNTKHRRVIPRTCSLKHFIRIPPNTIPPAPPSSVTAPIEDMKCPIYHTSTSKILFQNTTKIDQ